MTAALLIITAYLAGSIPFGLIIARSRGVDIRAHGSGNIGATNVGRVLGKKLGALCFVLDFFKGFGPTLFAGLYLGFIGPTPVAPTESSLFIWLSAMGATVIGHMFPVWLGFKGGKGVATGLGALLGVWPVLAIAAAGAVVVWLVSIKLSRMVGISSVFAALSLPVFVLVQPAIAKAMGQESRMDIWPFAAVTTALAAVVIIKHRANIARTLAGTENRVGRQA